METMGKRRKMIAPVKEKQHNAMAGYTWIAKMKGKSQMKCLKLEWLGKRFSFTIIEIRTTERRGRSHTFGFIFSMLLRHQGDVQKSDADDL